MARGPHPEDLRLFAPGQCAVLRRAAEEVSWLLERGYTLTTAVNAVGNHHQLHQRQRVGLARACAAPSRVVERRARALDASQLAGQALLLDGFNVIISLEVALCGGVLLRGRDGLLRDMAGLRGSYRPITQTTTAVELLRQVLTELEPESVSWYLDEPISNSRRLAALIDGVCADVAWKHRVDLVPSADHALFGMPRIASADALVVDRCGSWFDLVSWTLARHVGDAWVVSLEHDEPQPC